MGESACLLQQQPFCYASGISNEANESNLIHAFGQSISFGRFGSESLAWERWSTFSHNRYVEEAERFSRPGSVAEKKAFFEAHYKKLAAQKAAALLEQANNATSNNATNQEHDQTAHQATSPPPEAVHYKKQEVNVVDSKPNATPSDSHSNLRDNNRVEECPLVTNSIKVELQNQLEDVDTHKDASEKHSADYEDEVLAPMSTKKPPAFSLKSFESTETSKFSSTPAKPVSQKNENIMGTPVRSNKPALGSVDKKKPTVNVTPIGSVDKKRSTVKFTLISSVDKKRPTVSFTPIRELNRLTASVMRKFEGARVSKASKESSTPLRTPTKASKNQLPKHSSVTPLTERKRTKTPVGSLASGSNTAGSKWRLLSTENKMRSPIISSPFSLRTEERAARRKKKLEEKFNANEEQKVQLHAKLKEKAETEIRRLRQSFCFKARPLPDFYKERKESKNEASKCQLTNPESPKQGKKLTPSRVRRKSSVTPQKSTVKNNGTKNYVEKNGRSSNDHLTSNPRMSAQENAPPNIQHETPYDSNCQESTQRLEQGITRKCRRAWHKI
ncbi:protein WVD2-like 7 [Prosopis cineraria]|uniref:protein WVD2-like 7 n=1 Tax=Prosopis cineraria TaxID=364024 RepID=UPI00240EDD42|nr:protein WVD2-like 7 [Prosopis cineraria]